MAKHTKLTVNREFAIKTQTLSSGKTICVPLTRTVKFYLFKKIPVRGPWVRITETHGFYEVRDIDFEPRTEVNCQSIIEGYQKQLKELEPEHIISTDIINYEISN